MCRQTLTTSDGPERHRRFYLAVLVRRVCRACVRQNRMQEGDKQTGLSQMCQNPVSWGADESSPISYGVATPESWAVKFRLDNRTPAVVATARLALRTENIACPNEARLGRS